MEIWSLKGEETPSLINESSFGCFLPLVTLLGHSLEWYFFCKNYRLLFNGRDFCEILTKRFLLKN